MASAWDDCILASSFDFKNKNRVGSSVGGAGCGRGMDTRVELSSSCKALDASSELF